MKYIYHWIMWNYWSWRVRRTMRSMRKTIKEKGLTSIDEYSDEQIIEGFKNLNS